MQASTGQIFTGEEVQAMDAEKQKDMYALPDDTKLDTIRKLQKPSLVQAQRAAALKALNRAKNKAARQARKKNRGK